MNRYRHGIYSVKVLSLKIMMTACRQARQVGDILEIFHPEVGTCRVVVVSGKKDHHISAYFRIELGSVLALIIFRLAWTIYTDVGSKHSDIDT